MATEGTTGPYEWQGDDTPVCVRNTFIDLPLEHTFDERKVKSCPQSPVCGNRDALAGIPCLGSSPLLCQEEDPRAGEVGGAARMSSWGRAAVGAVGAEAPRPTAEAVLTGTVDAVVSEVKDAANIICEQGTEVEAVINGTVGAVVSELEDAANIIREQGVVRAVSGSIAQAVEQSLHGAMGSSPCASPGVHYRHATEVPAPPFLAPVGPGGMPFRPHGHSPLAQRSPPAGCVPGYWGMLLAFDHAIAGAVDAVADEMKDAANIIREQGLVSAVGGAVAQAVEQSLGACVGGKDSLAFEGECGAAGSSSSSSSGLPPNAGLVSMPPGNFGAGGKEMPSAGHPSPKTLSGDIDAALLEMGKAVELGSAELPSKGSALHSLERCKPCAFVLRGNCKDGVECGFCHLCQPGEKKRRRKVWKVNKREATDANPFAATSDPAPDFGDQPFRGYCARLVEEEGHVEAPCEGSEPAPEPAPAATCATQQSQQSLYLD